MDELKRRLRSDHSSRSKHKMELDKIFSVRSLASVVPNT